MCSSFSPTGHAPCGHPSHQGRTLRSGGHHVRALRVELLFSPWGTQRSPNADVMGKFAHNASVCPSCPLPNPAGIPAQASSRTLMTRTASPMKRRASPTSCRRWSSRPSGSLNLPLLRTLGRSPQSFTTSRARMHPSTKSMRGCTILASSRASVADGLAPWIFLLLHEAP